MGQTRAEAIPVVLGETFVMPRDTRIGGYAVYAWMHGAWRVCAGSDALEDATRLARKQAFRLRLQRKKEASHRHD